MAKHDTLYVITATKTIHTFTNGHLKANHASEEVVVFNNAELTQIIANLLTNNGYHPVDVAIQTAKGSLPWARPVTKV